MATIDRRGIVIGDSPSSAVSNDPYAGLAIKTPVRAATTANITLSGEQTVDGVALVANNRVLVFNQTAPIENGIYLVSTGPWERTRDFDGYHEVVKGTQVFITDGTLYGAKNSQVTSNDPITIGTTAVTWSTPFSAQPLSDREINAAGSVTIIATDDLVRVNKTVSQATTVNLIAAAFFGKSSLVIKDQKGDATNYPISVTPDGTETIDGQTGARLIDWPYGGLRLRPIVGGWITLP